ncbi:MAG: T9SS type A sorting domain-containing protein [Flavobacteriales bacterium]|nr:T9SS type A sorting domain-containing protein [Flavobacteriales bacterium]
MKYVYSLLVCILFSSQINTQTLTAPVAQDVYGGTVGDIEAWSFHSDSVYVVISTESPNSIFYSKASRAADTTNLDWTPLPSADIDDGYGGEIGNIEIHKNSNSIFFLHQSYVYKTDFTSTFAVAVDSLVKEFIIVGDTMFLVKNNPLPSGLDTLEFGTLSSVGNYSPTNGLSLLKTYFDPPQMIVNPSNNLLCIFERGASPHMLTFGDPVSSMTNSTSLSSFLYPAPIVPNIEWQTYGFANNGTWYVAGQPPVNNPTSINRYIAWSNSNGYIWDYEPINIPGPIGGVVGKNLIIDDLSTERNIFVGNAVLKDTNFMSDWVNPGGIWIDNFNRANDGFTKADPIINDLKYHSTNVGMGFSLLQSDSILGWNTGLEAVQVNDLDMNAGFTKGWVASKSGIRNVVDYNTSSEVWSSTIFPNSDGAPYKAVGMDPNNDNVIYVGNQRIYKTSNSGTVISPTNDGWSQVFTPENPPYNFNSINSYCTSIEVSPDNSSVVVAGFTGTYGDKGGFFYSLDSGLSWDQLLLVSSVNGQDVNVLDVEFSFENGNVVVYIGLESDPVFPGAYGLFRAELISGSWTLARDGSYGSTDGIVDIQINDTRDTLIFLNTDPSPFPVNNVQIKDLSSGAWTSSFGPYVGGFGTAITLGEGYLFMAIEENIYAVPLDFSAPWNVAYSYPVGTQINVLFYDDLLVGTGTGLYAQNLDLSTINIVESNFKKLSVYPNPTDNVLYLSNQAIFKVYNLTGELIYQSSKPESSFTTKGIESGAYIIIDSKGFWNKFIVK